MWLNRSLGRRITVLVSVLLLVVCAAVFAISYYQVLDLTRKASANRLRLSGRQMAEILARNPAQVATSMARFSSDPALAAALAGPGSPDTVVAAAVLRKNLSPAATNSYALVDPGGRVVLEVGPVGSPAWFGPPPEPAGESPRTGPVTGVNDTVLFFDVQVPLTGARGFAGALVQRSRLTVSRSAAAALSSLVGAGIQFVLGSPASGGWTDFATRVITPPSNAALYDSVVSVRWRNATHQALSLAVPGTPWTVVLLTPSSIVEAPAREYLRRGILVALVAIALGTLAAALLGARLAAPIRQMAQVSEQIAAGEEDRRADEGSPGEIGRLAHSFNTMLEQVNLTGGRLRESERSLRAFVSHSSQGIWHAEFVPPLSTAESADSQIDRWYERAATVECNQALVQMEGLELEGDLVQVSLARLFPSDHPQSRALLRKFIEQGYRCSEVQTDRPQGAGNPRVLVNDLIGLVEEGGLRRIWGTRRDVTVERLLDDRLAQSQRLEAIGRLAGGVAHDFNNLLTVVLAHSELLLDSLPGGSPERAGVVEINDTSRRAAQLTRQLLQFSRGQVARPDLLNLNRVVESVEMMLRRVIGEDIALTLRLAADLPAVLADDGQVEQVIMNLVVNARDAMPEGGVLELRTDQVEFDEAYVRLRPSVRAGHYVMLAVTDSGTGMPVEVQQHAFEPFFTTKAQGRGTGLGLATVYGIVRQSGGDVVIYSELGRGTTVKVFLPARTPGDVASVPGPRAAPAAVPGTERILVVEDEPALREIARRALAAFGYTVSIAGDSTEALRLLDQGTTIDLLLTDMILPGMSGRALMSEVRRRFPGLPVIIMSGYTGETYPALEALPEGVGYVEKPFALADLRQAVRRALDGPAGP